MEVLIGGEWINIYDLIDLEDIEQNHVRYPTPFIGQLKNYQGQLTKNPATKIDQDAYWMNV